MVRIFRLMLVLLYNIHINSTNIPPIMIINRIYETKSSVAVARFLRGRAKDLPAPLYSSTLSSTSAPNGMGGRRHAPAALLPGKTRYPFCRRLGGRQSRSGRKISPFPTGIRSPDRPARSSVAISTELSRLHFRFKLLLTFTEDKN